MRSVSTLAYLWVFLAAACADSSDTTPSESSILEFGPCTEFIGAYAADEGLVRTLVPEGYDLALDDYGLAQLQVRATHCQAITITRENGDKDEGGEHIVFQLGAGVAPPVTLEPSPQLVDAGEHTEFHAYATLTVTDFEPLADALTRAGFSGVHHADDLLFETGDDHPDSCELVPVRGALTTPADLAMGFSGSVRDLGLEPADGCVFGENDETGPERALWWNEGESGTTLSDTIVPNSQRLLFNADEDFVPLPVTFTPEGETLQAIVGSSPVPFTFTLSGILEFGEVSTTLKPYPGLR
ncbi:MAG: hypothetical protein AAGA48_37685 [Myxococcota bacterium]